MGNRPAFNGLRPQAQAVRRAPSEARGIQRLLTLWHQPSLLNWLADGLMLATSIAAGYVLVQAILNLPVFAIRELYVTTPLQQVTRQQIEFAARSGLKGGYFSVSLEEVRHAFEKLPWVRKAQVRRRWPNALELSLEEHVAVAHWRAADSIDEHLVNTYGEVFDASSNAKLPWFTGSDGSASLLYERYQNFNERFKKLDLKIEKIRLSPRQAWQLTLNNNMVLEFGRDDARTSMDTRLNRFIAIYPGLSEKLGTPLTTVDLRYPSGFAIRVAKGTVPQKSN